MARLVVGLGNPGPEYERTWHNLGFRVARSVARRLRISLKQKEQGLAGQGKYSGHEVTLLLPDSYMNLSGRPTAHWAKKTGADPTEILVIADDHDLPRGQLRLRPSGGDGGHRGLRSILNEVGTQDVPRLRIGIRNEESDPDVGGYDDLADRVLEPLSENEVKHMTQMAEAAADVVLDWIADGLISAMNRHNSRRIRPPMGGDQRESRKRNGEASSEPVDRNSD